MRGVSPVDLSGYCRFNKKSVPWSSLAALACAADLQEQAQRLQSQHIPFNPNPCKTSARGNYMLPVFSKLVLPSRQLATNAALPPSHIQQPVPRLLNNIRQHCRVCNLSYEPNRGLTSSNQHTQWCHHFCPHLSTSCGVLLLLQELTRPELSVTYPWTASRAHAAATSSSEPETSKIQIGTVHCTF